MEKIVIGIDLGTTYSSVSYHQAGKVILIENKSGNYRVPSIIHFGTDDEDEEEQEEQDEKEKFKLDIGECAKEFLSFDPKNTIYDTKRMIGRQYDDPEIQKLIPTWPFQIEKNDADGKILINLDKFGIKIEPYKVSGFLLKHLVKIGNEHLKQEQKTNEVIITIPANFCDEQRKETKLAAEFAGLKVLKLLNEPTAAGIDYGLSEKSDEKRLAVIFDFGGGTLDVSLVSIKGTDIKIIRTDGDMFLGGRNFDENVVEYLIDRLGLQEYLKDEKTRSRRMKILREKAVYVKEKLSEKISAKINIEFNEELQFPVTVKLSDFENTNQSLIDRICDPVKRLLELSKTDKNQINSIILVGGSSNMKFVKRKLHEFFDKDPIMYANSGAAVARGAAYVASQVATSNDDLFKSVNFEYKDVASYSIGVQTIGGRVSRIIEKGDILPVNKNGDFGTVYYRQDKIEIRIYEGPSEKVEDDYLLGEFVVENIPPSEKFIPFCVALSLDKNGILSASVKLGEADIQNEQQFELKRIKNNEINHMFKSEDLVYLNKKIFLDNMNSFIKYNNSVLIRCLQYTALHKLISQIKFYENDLDSFDLADIHICLLDMLKKYICQYGDSLPDFFVILPLD